MINGVCNDGDNNGDCYDVNSNDGDQVFVLMVELV